MDDFDLVVVGGGSGGVRGARVAATLGAKVALVESARLGGTCVNVGCVPKKLLAFGAHYAEDLHDMRAYGWSIGEARFDWGKLVSEKDREIERLNGIYRDLLVRAGVTLVQGFGKLVGPHEVAVGDRVLRGEKVLIATGGRPWRPEPQWLPGVEHTWVSDDLFALKELPRRILIVGGGYIACEFASILRGLRVEVQLALRGELPLRGFDEEIRAGLFAALTERGIVIRPGVSPTKIERRGAELVTHFTDGADATTDAVLMATGRIPNTHGLGLGEVGVAEDADGAIVVDEHFRTSVPSVYAVGDVVARLELTPVALAEAMVFAHEQYGQGGREVDYGDVPTAVFTSPQIGTVGLSEEAARVRYGDLDVYASSFRSLKHTLTGSPIRSLVKVLVDRATDRVVGIHVLDEDAAEMLQGFAVAMRCGLTKKQLDSTIGIHPTVAEELVTLRTPRGRG
jgi:glutathione reductase (NADPH)